MGFCTEAQARARSIAAKVGSDSPGRRQGKNWRLAPAVVSRQRDSVWSHARGLKAICAVEGDDKGGIAVRRPSTMANKGRKLIAGEWVEVRSKEEILRTLDGNGQLDGMPFMPEMFAVLRQEVSGVQACAQDLRHGLSCSGTPGRSYGPS